MVTFVSIVAMVAMGHHGFHGLHGGFRQSSRGEEGHFYGEAGHSGDQEPSGEDQQYSPALRG